MARKGVKLYIDSDASGVKRGVGQAQSSLRGFEGQAKKTQGSMSRLGSSAAGLGLAFGATGLALGLKSSIDAFKEQEKSTARVTAQLKALGVNTDAVRKKIQDVTTAQSKLSGFQDEDLQASFAGILRVTGDVNESLKLNALAMDISRGSGKSLNVVATAIAKVMDGNVAALGRYGVKAQKGATITDVLALAQKRYAGQAREFGDTTAGAADKASASINELQESIGAKLAPALNEAAGATIRLAGATGSFIDHAGGLGPIVAGAGGFGAFKLLAPSLGNAAGALGSLSRVAGTQGAGASFRVLGSAVGASINPMTAAAVGAGLLGAGIYTVWHNSESAGQAVQALNGEILKLHEAFKQQDVAKNAANTARDYANATGEAVTKARALGAGEKQLLPLIHAHESALTNLKSAQDNVRASADGVTESQAGLERKLRDVRNKARDAGVEVTNTGGRWGAFTQVAHNAGTEVAFFVSHMETAARTTDRSSVSAARADNAMAALARRLGRLPSITEMRLVTKYAAQGDSPDQIKRKLDALPSVKVISLITRQISQPFTQRNPINPTQPVRRAGGGVVPGRYADGDRVPAMLAGGEAVLNPLQIGMVDSGMSVMGALAATGAPTRGGAYAAGRYPTLMASERRRKRRKQPKRRAPGVAAAIEAPDLPLGIQEIIADAALTPGNADDWMALTTASQWLNQEIGRTSDPAARISLKQQLAGVLSSISSLSSGGGDTGSGAGPAVYDPAADLQARLDQSERNRSIAVRGGQLSEATLRTLTGPGDIGTGGGPRVTMMQVLGDQRSLQALAAGMSTGAGLQPSRAANRATINI